MWLENMLSDNYLSRCFDDSCNKYIISNEETERELVSRVMQAGLDRLLMT